MTNKNTIALAIATAIAASTPVYAQWSSDPATSAIQVTDSGNGPLVAADNDGGVYVTYRNGGYWWRAPDSSGFDVFLQHYDVNGNQSWESPLRIFDTDKSYTSFYGLVADEDGNAYVAEDVFPHGVNTPSAQSTVQIAKINKDGTPGWEAPLNLTPDNTLESVGLGLTMDAHGERIAVAWSQGPSDYTVDGYSGLAVIDKNGEVLWNKDIRINNRYTFATKPIVTGDGVFVILEVADDVGGTQSHYYVQKYALEDGTPLWKEPVALTSGDNFYHPVDSARSINVVRDGQGGIVLSWYHVNGYNQGIILLQHVHANGDKDFPGQGLRLSGDLLGNGATSMAYDGDNTYVTWSVHKKDYDADGVVQDYAGIRGVAVSRDGQFIWSEDGSSEPVYLLPWRQVMIDSEIPQTEWFSGYTAPRITLNQDDNLNLFYSEEQVVANTYFLFDQVIDPASGANVGERVAVSDGAIALDGSPGLDRTIFGQPVVAYAHKNDGAVYLVNFDGSGHSGVSEDILVEKTPAVTLMPGEEKTLDLKVLDNAGSGHDNTVDSASSQVGTDLSGDDTMLHLGLSTGDLLADTVPVTVKVQDSADSNRLGTSTIKVHAPYSMAPVIEPMADVSVPEGDDIDISADVKTTSDNPQLEWKQTAGPATYFEGDGSALHVQTNFVAEDTKLTFTLTATDDMQMTSQSVDILVTNTSSPSISGSDVSAEAGEQFTLSPEISNAKAPVSLTWTKSDGASTVYTVDDDGTLIGTAPLTAGEVVLTLHAVDANGESFSKNFTLTVTKPAVEPDPAPEPAKKHKKSGGSTGLPILLLGLAALTRRLFGKSDAKTNQNKV